jgi:hypothetical protein
MSIREMIFNILVLQVSLDNENSTIKIHRTKIKEKLAQITTTE